jgi:hypothetical protein
VAARFEIEGLADAAQWAELTDITAMLLLRLNSIHIALEPTELEKAKVDPDRVQLTEMARELVGSDEREAP